MKKILVLGGHGFVGKNVHEYLKKLPYKTTLLSRRDGLDLTDFPNTRDVFRRNHPDIIINCAAHVGSLHYVYKYAADVVSDNILMALNIYKAANLECRDVHVINPLSNCSYPGDADIHFEPDWWKGEVHDSVFAYGNAKRSIYVVSKCYKMQYGIRTSNFLVPNAFGPGDYTDPNKTHAINGMIIRMLTAKKNKESKFEIWGSGKPIREWGYIKDIASLLVQSIQLKEDVLYPVNLAQKKGYSIKESAKIIADLIGFGGKIEFNKKYQDGALRKVLDNKKFKKFFPKFKFTEHTQALKETVEYYKKELSIQ